MDWREKAFENLAAAERLLPSDEKPERVALGNAAASRAYYAAYHAVATAAWSGGHRFTSDEYYRHDSLADDAVAWGVLDNDQAADLLLLYEQRIKADYYEAHVTDDEAREGYDVAQDLVRALLQGDA